jgi:hypothetical protein
MHGGLAYRENSDVGFVTAVILSLSKHGPLGVFGPSLPSLSLPSRDILHPVRVKGTPTSHLKEEHWNLENPSDLSESECLVGQYCWEPLTPASTSIGWTCRVKRTAIRDDNTLPAVCLSEDRG